MPESPQKRVTRARAKATADTKITKKPTIITTPAAKATRATKRKTRADEEQELPIIQAPPAQASRTEPMKATRGRSKKVTTEKQMAAEEVEPEHDALQPIVEAPKARGRPKKVAVSVSKTATAPKKEESAPTRKVTRARAANPPAATTAKPTAPKKKVTWAGEATLSTWEKEVPGKENVIPLLRNARKPAASEEKGTTADKPTGLRAKPVRKPAAARATKRGKAATAEEVEKEEKPKAAPLSPKKATQVNLSSSISSDEDELAEPKTPTKALSRSPVKIPASAAFGSVKKSNNPELSASIDEIQLPSTGIKLPNKAFASSILASPARRPAATPFKDALKESAKKPLFGDLSVQQILKEPMASTPFKDAFKESAKKPVLGDWSVQQMLKGPTSPVKDSLRESPKRINLGDSILRSVAKPSKPSFKASLLQSPARRPMQTPRKYAAPKSPGKADIVVPITDLSTVSSQVSQFAMPTFTPHKNVSSPFRAAKSPEQSTKVHKMTPKEQQELARHDWIKSPFPLSVGFGTTPATTSKSRTPGPIEAQMSPINSLQTSKTPIETPTFGRPTPSLPQEALLSLPSPSVPEANHFEQSPTAQNKISSTTPVGLPSQLFTQSAVSTPVFQGSPADSTSEDELHGDNSNFTPITLGHLNISTNDFASQATRTPAWATNTPSFAPSTNKEQQGKPATVARDSALFEAGKPIEMTPLALQFGKWQVTSPDKKILDCRPEHGRGIFSPALTRQILQPEPTLPSTTKPSPVKTCFFEDEMSVRDQSDSLADEVMDFMEDDLASMPPTETSTAEENYGDENTIPIDPVLLAAHFSLPESNATCTPAKVFSKTPQIIHTVSKIPLKAAADETPSRIPVQRRQSVGGALASRIIEDSVSFDKSRIAVPRSHGKALTSSKLSAELITKSLSTPIKSTNVPLQTQTPGLDQWSFAGTPTPRPALNLQTLKGAVVFVDVYTTEGADASGIFIELLTQMGARCVKQWTWNPDSSNDIAVENNSSTPSGKIGITHVVFKDGGKRTLEKVRRCAGVVSCVGVGWVLDCERDNKWLDEAEYAVDTALIPRGGMRRRKSMEPRAVLGLNTGFFSAAASEATPKPPAREEEISPTKEFLTFDTPTDRRASFLIVRPSPSTQTQDPSTPSQTKTTNTFTPPNNNDFNNEFNEDENENENNTTPYSPTTPYYLSKGAQLIQQTCPPQKEGNKKLLFPISGEIGEQPDECVRRRLVLARRKSLQWAPKVGSPLGRG